MGKRKLAIMASAIVLLIGAAALGFRGLTFGIDFTGGTLVEVGYEQAVEPETVRSALADNGFDDAQVQQFGTPQDILLRLAPREDMKSAELSDRVFKILSDSTDQSVELRRVEFVGPQVGDELAEDGALAVLVALMAILLYVALRFEWRFAVGSVVALVHDVLFTLGLFALLQLEFDLTVLAAVLAVIGYSLNDTIVVFDRIRENMKLRRKESYRQVINRSINECLSRTVLTSLTTFFVAATLYFFGGPVIHDFAFALCFGVVVGTYSSMFIASPILVWWYERRISDKKRMSFDM